MTGALFRDDGYLKSCEATVEAINDRGGIILDRTVFYAAGGGQPGDGGQLTWGDAGNGCPILRATGLGTGEHIISIATNEERPVTYVLRVDAPPS